LEGDVGGGLTCRMFAAPLVKRCTGVKTGSPLAAGPENPASPSLAATSPCRNTTLSCRRLFPFARCVIERNGEFITRIRAVESNADRPYALPSLRTPELTLTLDPLIPLLRGNMLVLTLDGQAYELTTQDPVGCWTP
jgi:hypothetical protein